MKNFKPIIENRFQELNFEYQFIRLPDNISIEMEEHMQFHGASMKHALATLVFKTERGLVAVQKRGDTQIDNKKLKAVLKTQKLRVANQDEMEQLELETGFVPVLGLNLPYFIDAKLLQVDDLYGSGGDKIHGLKFRANDLSKLNGGQVVDVTSSSTGQKRIFSGIRATGRLHLGNYLGAVKGMLTLQDDPNYEMFFAVVDIHAMTTPYDPATLAEKTRDVVLDYLAAGMDPEKSAILVQSKVADLHAELMFYFSTVSTIARMQHLPTFKEKVKQHPDHVTMALLNYPLLMAADILLYKSELIPVGIDQEPHLEVTREIARKMNAEYGLDFPEPIRFATKGGYVPSLAGTGKMSKSIEGSYINMTDDLATIQKRLAGAPTDSGNGEQVPTEGGVANLLQFVELFQGVERRREYEQQYTTTGIRYGDLKQELANTIYAELKPIQEKRAELVANIAYVDKIITDGAAKARAIAQQTLNEVKEKLGLR